MTDNTSPVATLAARLPKGNGLTRAVEQLHGHNGALVPFIGYLEVEESGEDKNEVLKIRTSIARLELCTGDLERDAKEQDPPLSDADAAQRWNDFQGGNYGALDQAAPAYLREFLLTIGALPDQPTAEVPEPEFSDAGAETDDDAADET